MLPFLPITRTHCAYLAFALWGSMAVSMALLVLTVYTFNDTEYEWEIINTAMKSNLNGVSTRSKHTSGFACAALFGDLGIIPGSAPPCLPPIKEEMVYGLQNPTKLIFRLCCDMDYKLGRRHCEGRVPCGHTTSQRHCAARDALLFNDVTRELEYKRRAGSGGWCPLEDEATCCIWKVIDNYAVSVYDRLANKMQYLSAWDKFLFVGKYYSWLVPFIPPFITIVIFIN